MKAAIAMIASLCALDALAAPFERTIEAPERVGDVVALTNALAEFNALATQDDRSNARILLKPGVYNLADVYMTDKFHLCLEATKVGGLFAGLGTNACETVLLGGGVDGKHGVIECKGSGNWGIFTISNLTVTGGYSLNNGGGIKGSSSVEYRNLIVSNNYATGTADPGAGGGGCFLGRAFDCLFEKNRTEKWGGGFNVQGRCARLNNEGQGAWRCIFRNNSAKEHGGAFAIRGGQCIGCEFWDNFTDSGYADVLVQTLSYTTFDGLPRTTHVADCKFVGGVGLGYSIESDGRVSVSNCTFRANNSMGKNGVVYGCDMNDCVMESNTNGKGIAYKSCLVNCKVMCNTGIAVNDCELKDCFVETNTTASAIVKDCNMERCVVRGNTITTRFDSGVDICSTYGCHTNVNCLIVDNAYTSEYGPILKNKVLVNCTIVDNNAANGNWGRPIDACALWNCVLWGNKLGTTLCDVRTKTKEGGAYSMSLTNCVFVTSDLNAMDIAADGTVMHEGIGNCRQLSMTALKLVDEPNGDYTPKTRSTLYGTGCEDSWILSLVGSKDLVGNVRVFGEGIDIGAYECQCYPPGLVLSVK